VNSLEIAIAEARVRTADVLLFRNGERGWLNAGIRYAQARALADLAPKLPRYFIARCASYTHAAQLTSPECFSEQYAPRARCRRVSSLPRGAHIMVRRLRSADNGNTGPILQRWKEVVGKAEPYPVRELLYYYLRWVRKTWLAHKFAEAFKDAKHNVCSGQVVACSQAVGWFSGEKPEAWYPARLVEDALWLETVGEFDI